MAAKLLIYDRILTILYVLYYEVNKMSTPIRLFYAPGDIHIVYVFSFRVNIQGLIRVIYHKAYNSIFRA